MCVQHGNWTGRVRPGPRGTRWEEDRAHPRADSLAQKLRPSPPGQGLKQRRPCPTHGGPVNPQTPVRPGLVTKPGFPRTTCCRSAGRSSRTLQTPDPREAQEAGTMAGSDDPSLQGNETCPQLRGTQRVSGWGRHGSGLVAHWTRPATGLPGREAMQRGEKRGWAAVNGTTFPRDKHAPPMPTMLWVQNITAASSSTRKTPGWPKRPVNTRTVGATGLGAVFPTARSHCPLGVSVC